MPTTSSESNSLSFSSSKKGKNSKPNAMKRKLPEETTKPEDERTKTKKKTKKSNKGALSFDRDDLG
ncbi:hypothetical protein M422DRAFT_27051 [Sphaerobolus stellatus SS14]|nr:hypothetical protein M422DRAFT_27051 [Sphaerobolus stellatus SS14]